MSARRLLLRTAAALVLFSALGGNAPGNVLGCSSTLPSVPDQEFCLELRLLQCQRDLLAERITDDEFVVCGALETRTANCVGFMAPCDIPPGNADQCFDTLRRVDLFPIDSNEILSRPECNICN